jgi:hypothetical protein
MKVNAGCLELLGLIPPSLTKRVAITFFVEWRSFARVDGVLEVCPVAVPQNQRCDTTGIRFLDA